MTIPPSARALAIDTELRDRVRQIHVHENHVAHLLARMDADKLHEEFGYAKVVDYAVERLGLARSVSYALLRIGKKLPDLPHLDRAMADGQLGWTKVREMVRVATPETERDWVALAGTHHQPGPRAGREGERRWRSAVPRGPGGSAGDGPDGVGGVRRRG